MKKEDLVYLCTIVGNLSGIPVRLYKDDRLCFYHSVVLSQYHEIYSDK